MDSSSRRGVKEQDIPRTELTTRERVARLSAIERLRTSPDFWVMKDFIIAAIASHEKGLRRRVVTPQEQAEHHFTLGLLAGLDFALRGTEIIEESQTPPLANET